MIKLLLVDDSALMRKLLGRIFGAEADCDIRFARNGIEAVEQNRSFQPDVITLDVHMPEMDGLSCLNRIMLERPCPVVMVSSHTREGAEATLEALRLGAVDFIAKPTGAISLGIHDMAPLLLRKVREAASARPRISLRLKERVRHRIGTAVPEAPRPRTITHPVNQGEGLVVIGTSTGGPPALETLLTGLQADFPWPILIAQHMPAGFTGPLAQRLNSLCALTVVEVTRPTKLVAGTAYIGCGDADIIVSRRANGLIALAAPVLPDYLWHPSTDRLVRSAMEHLAAMQIIGVLMTGMGSDGAAAMAPLRKRGGRTIAESEETAVVWGMPGELVKANGADWVLPLPAIAARLTLLLT